MFESIGAGSVLAEANALEGLDAVDTGAGVGDVMGLVCYAWRRLGEHGQRYQDEQREKVMENHGDVWEMRLYSKTSKNGQRHSIVMVD